MIAIGSFSFGRRFGGLAELGLPWPGLDCSSTTSSICVLNVHTHYRYCNLTCIYVSSVCHWIHSFIHFNFTIHQRICEYILRLDLSNIDYSKVFEFEQKSFFKRILAKIYSKCLIVLQQQNVEWTRSTTKGKKKRSQQFKSHTQIDMWTHFNCKSEILRCLPCRPCRPNMSANKHLKWIKSKMRIDNLTVVYLSESINLRLRWWMTQP